MGVGGLPGYIWVSKSPPHGPGIERPVEEARREDLDGVRRPH
jgi:hypothetical protein